MPHQGTIINFPGQASDEQIFIYARRYPLAFLPNLALIFLMTILGALVIGLTGINDIIPFNFQVLVGSAFLLFMLLFTLIEFVDFYFDVYIMTDRRIVEIRQEQLFSRSVDELLLENIEDVDARVRGILATLFDFGDVEIQTAGSKPNFLFAKVRHPREMAAIILDLSSQAKEGRLVAMRHPSGPVAAIINDRMLPHTPDHEDEIS